MTVGPISGYLTWFPDDYGRKFFSVLCKIIFGINTVHAITLRIIGVLIIMRGLVDLGSI